MRYSSFQFSYQKSVNKDLRQKVDDAGDVEGMKAELAQLWIDFDAMTKERDAFLLRIEEKEEEIEQLLDEREEVVVTMKGGDYLPEFRHLIYTLLGANIPQSQVSNVIEKVLGFAGKKASSLPTEKTIRKMNLERGAVSQIHIGEKLEKSGLTLETDETAKLGHKVGAA